MNQSEEESVKSQVTDFIERSKKILDKDRARSAQGDQEFIDEARAWKKECWPFIQEHGPAGANDIPKDERRALLVCLEDMKMQNQYYIFLRELHTRSDSFKANMAESNADMEQEHTTLKSSLERYEEFYRRFVGSNGYEKLQKRSPQDAEEMTQKMKREISRLRSTLLTTKSSSKETETQFPDVERFLATNQPPLDEPIDISRKSIDTIMELLEHEEHPGLDNIREEYRGNSTQHSDDESTDDEEESEKNFHNKAAGVQRKVMKALLGVDAVHLNKDSKSGALSAEYMEILKDLNRPDSKSLENQNRLCEKIVQFHGKIIDKKLDDVMTSIRSILDKSDDKKLAEYRKLFEKEERTAGETKGLSIDVKIHMLSALEGNLKWLKLQSAGQPRVKPPSQFNKAIDARKKENAGDQNKRPALMGKGRGKDSGPDAPPTPTMTRKSGPGSSGR
jgi:hypothetical protein